MSFLACTCDRIVPVFREDGVYYCVKCFMPREEVTAPPEAFNAFGKLARFVEQTGRFFKPDNVLDKNDLCWLESIFVIARCTSGNFSFRQRVSEVVKFLYGHGCFDYKVWDGLKCFEKGMRVYHCVGPVPGVALYFNRGHCSAKWFPGAMWVTTNLPLLNRTYFPDGVRCGSAVAEAFLANQGRYFYSSFEVMIEGTQLTILGNSNPQDKIRSSPLPTELRDLVTKIRKAWWPQTPFPAEAARLLCAEGLSFGTGGYGVALDHGACWASIFGGRAPTYISHALNRGFMTRYGIEGGLLNRFLAEEGVRLVRASADEAEYVLSSPQKGHWQLHLGVVDAPRLPFIVCYLKVEPNFGDVTDARSFRFSPHVRVGSTGGVGHPFDLKPGKHNPPGDGGCGLNILQAVYHARHGRPVSWKSFPLDSNNWLSDDDIITVSAALGLGIGIRRSGVCCPKAKHLVDCNNNHWVLTTRKKSGTPALSYSCAQGVCSGKCEYPQASTPMPYSETLFQRLYEHVKAGHSVKTFQFVSPPEGKTWAQVLRQGFQCTSPSPAPRKISSVAATSTSSASASLTEKVAPIPAARTFRSGCGVRNATLKGDQGTTASTTTTEPGEALSAAGIEALAECLIEDQEDPSQVLSNLSQHTYKGSQTPAMTPPPVAVNGTYSLPDVYLPPYTDEPSEAPSRFDELRAWLAKRLVFPKNPRSLVSFTQAFDILARPGTVKVTWADYVLFAGLCLTGLGSLVHPWFWAFSLLTLLLPTPRAVLGAFVGILCFIVAILTKSQDSFAECDAGMETCRPVLESFIVHRASALDPVPTLGVVGVGVSVFANVVGGSTLVYLAVLRLAFLLDFIFIGVGYFLSGACTKCWGHCIRTAPREVSCNTVPMMKIARNALLTLSDGYCSPPVDIIKLATGYSGCYCGTQSMTTFKKAVPYAKLDKNKIGNGTVVPLPNCPNQAKEAINVILSGGLLSAGVLPPVTKVTSVPFSSPYFPVLPVSDAPIVVDQSIYSRLSSEQKLKVILGQGDFVTANQIHPPEIDPTSQTLWAEKILTPARMNFLTSHQIKVLREAGYAGGAALVGLFVYVVSCLILGLLLQQTGICGVNTNDAFCRNPFSRPTIGYEGYCHAGYCLSSSGLAVAGQSPVVSLVSYAQIALLVLIALLGACKILHMSIYELTLLILPFCQLVWWPLAALNVLSVGALFVGVNTLVGLVYLFVLLAINPIAGLLVLAAVLLSVLCRWLPGVPCLVTPYDLGRFVTNPRNAAAIAGATPGSYHYALRQSALTGKNMLYIPTASGISLEGLRRKHVVPSNVVVVTGSASGCGSVWNLNGTNTVITATHLLDDDNQATVCLGGQTALLTFRVQGDFACAPSPFNYCHPQRKFGQPNGPAFWLTASGAERGFCDKDVCICYTDCGDSGSPVINSDGDIIGVHTGSNKRGLAVVTYPDGRTVGYGQIPLSKLVPHYGGEQVPVPTIPANIIKDTETVPAELATALAVEKNAEGALPVVSLIVAFMVLWRLLLTPQGVPIMCVFFIVNEFFPSWLVRALFGMFLDLCQLIFVHPGMVLGVRLMTAALHKNSISLVFWVAVAAVNGFVDGLNTNYLLPNFIDKPTAAIGLMCLHVVLAICRWLLPALPTAYYGEGHFSRAFLARMMAEGATGIKAGVASSTFATPESLSTALATSFTEDDLQFLAKHLDSKCVRSATNLVTAAKTYIEVSFAKSMIKALSGVAAKAGANTLLARLEDFACGVSCVPEPGDKVVFIGKFPQVPILERSFDGQVRRIVLQEDRIVAGTMVTIGTCVALEGGCVEVKRVDGKPQLLVNGRRVAFEDDGRDADPTGTDSRHQEHCGQVEIGGQSYDKFWNKKTGDVYYRKAGEFTGSTYHQREVVIGRSTHTRMEPDSPGRAARNDDIYSEGAEESSGNLSVRRMTVEEALSAMGANPDLTSNDINRLNALIDKLVTLRDTNKCLNS